MMLLCLVSLNDTPPVVWPVLEPPLAWPALCVTVRLALLDEAVTRMAVELVEDDGDDWQTWRGDDGRDVGALLDDYFRDESRALWERYRMKRGAIVQYEALA